MKPCMFALVVLALGLVGCGSSGGTPEVSPATQGPKTPAEVQEALMAEWQPVHDQAAVLVETCFMVSETQYAYSHGEISLERALTEQEAESGFIRSAQQTTSAAEPPSEVVASYTERLEEPTSVLLNVLESGEEALVDNDLNLWIGIVDTCSSLLSITEGIAADAQAAGIDLESLTQLGLEIYPVIEDVQAVQSGRTAADRPPQATKAAVPVATQGIEASAGQEELKDEWGRVFSATEVMTEVCIVVFETNMDFSLGEISLDRARTEVAAEDDFIAFVRGVLAPPSDRVAPHQEQLEAAMAELTEILEYEPGSIGTPEVFDATGRPAFRSRNSWTGSSARPSRRD